MRWPKRFWKCPAGLPQIKKRTLWRLRASRWAFSKALWPLQRSIKGILQGLGTSFFRRNTPKVSSDPLLLFIAPPHPLSHTQPPLLSPSKVLADSLQVLRARERSAEGTTSIAGGGRGATGAEWEKNRGRGGEKKRSKGVGKAHIVSVCAKTVFLSMLNI